MKSPKTLSPIFCVFVLYSFWDIILNVVLRLELCNISIKSKTENCLQKCWRRKRCVELQKIRRGDTDKSQGAKPHGMELPKQYKPLPSQKLYILGCSYTRLFPSSGIFAAYLFINYL